MPKTMKKILGFYKFVKINDAQRLKKDIFSHLRDWGILGTVIIAPEGINVNICGDSDKIKLTRSFLLKRLKISKIISNEDNIEEMAFTKLKVKVKKEIIKLGLTLKNDEIFEDEHVSPKEWDKIIDSETVILDTRNKFEYLMGSFKNSVNLDLYNFSDLENKISDLPVNNKSDNIAIFCTGGIRCEKASIILKKFGHQNILQLKGGILNYLREYPDSDKWQGECFVFDDRITY